MKKGKKQQSPDNKMTPGKNLLKKAAQGAVVLGTLNIALSGFAADSSLVQKNARDLAAQGIVNQNSGRTLANDPAGVGKQSKQLTEKDRAAAAAAQKKIQDARALDDGVTGGPCGIAKSLSSPTKR